MVDTADHHTHALPENGDRLVEIGRGQQQNDVGIGCEGSLSTGELSIVLKDGVTGSEMDDTVMFCQGALDSMDLERVPVR